MRERAVQRAVERGLFRRRGKSPAGSGSGSPSPSPKWGSLQQAREEYIRNYSHLPRHDPRRVAASQGVYSALANHVASTGQALPSRFVAGLGKSTVHATNSAQRDELIKKQLALSTPRGNAHASGGRFSTIRRAQAAHHLVRHLPADDPRRVAASVALMRAAAQDSSHNSLPAEFVTGLDHHLSSNAEYARNHAGVLRRAAAAHWGSPSPAKHANSPGSPSSSRKNVIILENRAGVERREAKERANRAAAELAAARARGLLMLENSATVARRHAAEAEANAKAEAARRPVLMLQNSATVAKRHAAEAKANKAQAARNRAAKEEELRYQHVQNIFANVENVRRREAANKAEKQRVLKAAANKKAAIRAEAVRAAEEHQNAINAQKKAAANVKAKEQEKKNAAAAAAKTRTYYEYFFGPAAK